MANITINGGQSLCGKVNIHGAKNSALPITTAAFLCDSPVVLHNVPKLSDVAVALSILQSLGCKVKREEHSVTIYPSNCSCYKISSALMHKMRSSIIFLGAVIAKNKKASLCLPGGCELGPRPIDLHLLALRQMGVCINECKNKLDCCCKQLIGASIHLPFPSVGATENIILAATKAKGTTTIHNAACEPEITDLADFLNKCGAKISGQGSNTVEIVGVNKLTGCEHDVIADRIEAGTYMCASAITSGDVLINNINPMHLQSVIYALKQAGCEINVNDSSLRIISPKKLNNIEFTKTLVYPGFPTDMLSPLMATMTVASGSSTFVETIFQNRFKQVGDLVKMGACIKVEGREALINGVKHLIGTKTKAEDLRGGAALILAGLCAKGETQIYNINHIDRGYEAIESGLSSLGANIKRIK